MILLPIAEVYVSNENAILVSASTLVATLKTTPNGAGGGNHWSYFFLKASDDETYPQEIEENDMAKFKLKEGIDKFIKDTNLLLDIIGQY